MLQIERLSHAYGEIVSLRQVSLALPEGEILCLLGPSGCGKTTLLRIIAGLETDYSGELRFNGVDMRAIPAHRRGFGLMFQDFALFPHLSVADNIAYGLRRLGKRREEIDTRVQSLLRRVGLDALDERDVASLSGGQKQRVALARSLAPNPRLLMLDEPLGSLDAQLRDQLALELRRVIKRTGVSAIYVTHDQREAYAVADRIVVMNRGRVQQQDSPRGIYQRPARAFVARFLGLNNIFAIDDSRLATVLGVDIANLAREAGAVLIHPAGVGLADDGTGQQIELEAMLEEAVFRGARYEVSVLAAQATRLTFALDDLPSNLGERLRIHIRRDSIIPLED